MSRFRRKPGGGKAAPDSRGPGNGWLALVFGSGACALVYEVVWTRMLIPVLGNTVSATSMVLAVFMGGMALGSFLAGRRTESGRFGWRSGDALRVFGFLELGVGLVALAFPHLMGIILPWISESGVAAGGNGFYGSALRAGACFGLLLAPATLMGAAFPVFGVFYIHGPAAMGRLSARVYGINTAGGILGVLAAGFFLVRYLGASKTLFYTAGVNFLLAALAFWGSTRHRPPGGSTRPAAASPPAPKRPASARSGAVSAVVIAATGVSGFCALAYEVLWTRLLVLLVQNSVYAFSLILAGFLGGIALGSALAWAGMDRFRDRATALGAGQVLIGVLCLLVPFWFAIPQRPGDISYLSFLLATPLVVVMAPVVLMGAMLPLAVGILKDRWPGAGRNLGTVYAVNTAGALFGALACGFWMIPVLGCRDTVWLLSALNVLAGAAVLGTARRSRPWRAATGVAAALLVASFHFLLPGDIIRHYNLAAEPGGKLTYYREGRCANIAVFETGTHNKVLCLNGLPEVTNDTPALRTFRLMGFLPFVLHPSPENGLLITFGAGITAGTAVRMVDRLVCVELNEKCPEIAEIYRAENHNVMADGRLELVIDDGRNYLLSTREAFSVIVSDATHPQSYDSWILFTREFYELCLRRMDDRGVFCQWLPFHGLSPAQYRTIVRTVADVFPHLTIWSVDHAYSLLIATRQGFGIDARRLATALNRRELRPLLGPLGLENPYAILKCFVAGDAGIQAMTERGTRFNTDDRPHNQFFPLAVTGNERLRWHIQNLKFLYRHREDVRNYMR